MAGGNGEPGKILLVGDYVWPWYQDACAAALESLGCRVVRFGWFEDFRHRVPGRIEPVFNSFLKRAQYRLLTGPAVWQVNRRLIRVAQAERPDVVWFYNVRLISPATVKKLREILPDAVFCQYANDNPFSEDAKRGFWRNFIASIPYFHHHFTYRHRNIDDFRRHGSKRTHLLRSYFIPEADHPEPPENIPARFKCDVVFAGHYEDDGRVALLEAVSRAGFKLNLFGGGWEEAGTRIGPDSPLRAHFPIAPVTDADYRYAISGAKVALCFLSSLNQDTYTRRSFQIPAMRTCMLSQHTDDLATLYRPDTDAVFFSDERQLLAQLDRLVRDDNLRSAIAESGYRRVLADGHDVKSRMAEFLEKISTDRHGELQ